MKTTKFILLSIMSFVAMTLNANAQLTSGSQKSNQPSQKTAKQYSSDMSVFHKGDNIANLTIGITDFDYVPPFAAVSYEKIVYQLNDNLCVGVGGTIGLTGVRDIYGLGIYALGNMHLTAVQNLDLFAGLDLGKTFGIGAEEFNDWFGDLFSSAVHPFHVGASYFFSDKLAATARVYGWGVLSIGIATRF